MLRDFSSDSISNSSVCLFQLEGVQDMAAVPTVEHREESDDPLATPDVDKYIY